MKKICKFLNVLIVTAMIINIFAPLSVLADPEDVITLTFTVDEGANIVLEASDDGIGGKLTTVTSTSWFGFNQNATTTAYALSNPTCANDKKSCTVSITMISGKGVDVSVGGDSGIEFGGGNENITQSSTIHVRERQDGGDTKDNEAYLIWSCGNKICYKLMEHMDEHDRVNYVKASTIKATNDANETFDVHAKKIFMAPVDKFMTKKDAIEANSITIDSLMGPPEDGGIDYQPLNDEPKENNAYVSYADRNFKLIVFSDEYKGITIGNIEDLHYYPREMIDIFVRRESYDISGTTKDEPVEIDTVLLENKLTLRLQSGAPFDSYSISKIEALDVPEDAVTITKKAEDGSFSFEFNSNYYDKVVFKATDADNHEYFFYINRRTIDPYVDGKLGNETAKMVAEVFYDRNDHYDDYVVIGKIVYKDGTKKVVRLSAISFGDLMGHNVTEYELDEENMPYGIPGGKGIKRTKYAYELSTDEFKKIDKIYLNVEKKGTTSTTYAGNFAGSGQGDVLDMKYWEYWNKKEGEII